MIFTQAGQTFNAVFVGAPADMLGQIGVTIIDAPDTVVVPRTTNVVYNASPPVYVATLTAPEARDEIYLVVWDGPDGLSGTEELLVSVDPVNIVPVDYQPTIAQVAQFILARTHSTTSGRLLKTFATDTEPTQDEVQSLINFYKGTIADQLGPHLPAEFYDSISVAIALRVAMAVERSYYGGEIESGRSPYQELSNEFDSMMERLQARIDQALISDDDPTNDPPGENPNAYYYYPPTSLFTRDQPW